MEGALVALPRSMAVVVLKRRMLDVVESLGSLCRDPRIVDPPKSLK